MYQDNLAAGVSLNNKKCLVGLLFSLGYVIKKNIKARINEMYYSRLDKYTLNILRRTNFVNVLKCNVFFVNSKCYFYFYSKDKENARSLN